MPEAITIKQLLEAGVHFGHQTRRWNPKMARFIFTDRNGVYIIDLEKTLKHLETTCQYLRALAQEGSVILFVGTKRQAQDAIYAAAMKTEMPYVNQRWVGGLLTNFETVRKSVKRLDEIEAMEAEGTYKFMTKKEVAHLRKKREALLKVLVGVRKMKRLPDAVFVVDPKQEEIAVLEARRLNIPVVALVDTNCDPDLIDHPIPGNDDAIRSVKLICEVVSDAIKAGRDESLRLQTKEESGEDQDGETDAPEEALPAEDEPKAPPAQVESEESEIDKAQPEPEEDPIVLKVDKDLSADEKAVQPKPKRGRPRKEKKAE